MLEEFCANEQSAIAWPDDQLPFGKNHIRSKTPGKEATAPRHANARPDGRTRRHDRAVLEGTLRSQEREALVRGAQSQQHVLADKAQLRLRVGKGGLVLSHHVMLIPEITYNAYKSNDSQYDETRTIFVTSFMFIGSTIAAIILKNSDTTPLTYILPMFFSGIFLVTSILLEWRISRDRQI